MASSTIEDLFSALQNEQHPSSTIPVISPVSVVADIKADAGADVASVYTAYEVAFSAREPKPGQPVKVGTLAPGQMLPMWKKTAGNWNQLTALQLTSWSAASYGGVLWLSRTEDQRFFVEYGEDILSAHATAKLAAPGGRCVVNVLEDYPAVLPFQHTPVRPVPPRVVNAMGPCAWHRAFAGAIVLPSSRPGFKLVEIVDYVYEDNPKMGAGNFSMYDPVAGAHMECRPLDLPLGMEFGEVVMENIDWSPRTMREVIAHAVSDLLAKSGNPDYIGFAWLADEETDAQGDDLDSKSVHTAGYTRQFVYKSTLNEGDRNDFRKFGTPVTLQRMQNGVYEMDLA